MKKAISAIIVCLLLLGSVFALVSCDSIEDGRYVSSSGIAFELIDGSFVVSSDTARGYADYEIDDGKLILTFDKVEYIGNPDKASEFEESRAVVEARFKNEVCRTFKYEKVDDGIVLDGLKFVKQ